MGNFQELSILLIASWKGRRIMTQEIMGTHRYGHYNQLSGDLIKFEISKHIHDDLMHAGVVTRIRTGVFEAQRNFGGKFKRTFIKEDFPVNENKLLDMALRWACGGCDTLIKKRS